MHTKGCEKGYLYAALIVIVLMGAVATVQYFKTPTEPAPQQVYPWYDPGDLVRNASQTGFVIVTDYNTGNDTYTVVPALVNLNKGIKTIGDENPRVIDRIQFQSDYPTGIHLWTEL